jgi:Uma2 family endonuclease
MGEVLEQLGGIEPRRVRLYPAPGKATEKDLIRFNELKNHLYELVDGILVEKVMGYPEATLASWLGHLLWSFLEKHDLGFIAGADGAARLMAGLVRVPDLSFVSWDRVPVRGEIPSDPISGLAPDLAVEVLSAGNTKGEMDRKLREYFLAGVRLIWYVDPAARTVEVHSAPDQVSLRNEEETLDGGEVLPGLSLPVRIIFTHLPKVEGKKPRVRNTRPRKGKQSPRTGREG